MQKKITENSQKNIDKPIDRLEILLKDYLIRESNYAVLLTGKWGTGKTHYLNNKFFKNIKDTGYTPIMVSLFGAFSVDDIKDKIFIEVYPIINNKYLKVSKTLLKTFLKSVDVSKLFGEGIVTGVFNEIDKGKEELSGEKFNFLNLNKLLICFDDLERVSSDKLTNSEILGFINSLVENDNIKIIIVANEGKIPPKVFKEIKEKTIGNTIHFAQDFSSAFFSIIESTNTTQEYKNFLLNNEDTIHLFLSENNSASVNYRTLKYFISYFSDVFNLIKHNLEIDDLTEKSNIILSSLLRFSLMICIEYKKGEISFLDKKGVEDSVTRSIMRSLNRNKGEIDKSYAAQTLFKYFPNDDYYFYNSLYDYLTGGDFFNNKKLIEEISHQYNVSLDVISDAYKTFQKLQHNSYQNLSDKDHRESTRDLKNYALSGEYAIWDYLTIFYYLMRNGNVLNLSPSNLLKKFLKVIRSKQATHIFHPAMERYLSVSNEAEFYEYLLTLREEIIKVNNQSLIKQDASWIKNVEEDLSKNYLHLEERLFQEMNTRADVSFKNVNPKVFYKAFNKAENIIKTKMIVLLDAIYQGRYNSIEDLSFLENLQTLTDKRNKQKSRSNSAFLFRQLNQLLLDKISYMTPKKIN